MKQVPPLLTPAEIAQACEWPTWRMRRILVQAGVARRIGTRWMVGESLLRERLPDVYTRVYEHLVLSAEIDNEPNGDEPSGTEANRFCPEI